MILAVIILIYYYFAYQFFFFLNVLKKNYFPTTVLEKYRMTFENEMYTVLNLTSH